MSYLTLSLLVVIFGCGSGWWRQCHGYENSVELIGAEMSQGVRKTFDFFLCVDFGGGS